MKGLTITIEIDHALRVLTKAVKRLVIQNHGTAEELKVARQMADYFQSVLDNYDLENYPQQLPETPPSGS